MKNIIILSFAFALLLGSCVRPSKYERVKSLGDSLITEQRTKDMLVANLFSSFLSMDDNIALMDSCLVALVSYKDTMLMKIEADRLVNLIDKTESMRIDMSENAVKLEQGSMQVDALVDIINNYTKQLEVRNMSWSLLRDSMNLTDFTFQQDSLELSEVEDLTMLNTVYYLALSEGELLSRDVILKPGFIGQAVEVNPDANLQIFNKVNMNNFSQLQFFGKKFQLLTSHPAGSYYAGYNKETGAGELIVKNSEKFWANSRVLVISYK